MFLLMVLGVCIVVWFVCCDQHATFIRVARAGCGPAIIHLAMGYRLVGRVVYRADIGLASIDVEEVFDGVGCPGGLARIWGSFSKILTDS